MDLLNSEFWNKRIYDIEETVSYALNGDCIIYSNGNFIFLGDYGNLDYYYDKCYGKKYFKSVQDYVDYTGNIIWINISDDKGIILPTNAKMTSEQIQTITAIKDIRNKSINLKKK